MSRQPAVQIDSLLPAMRSLWNDIGGPGMSGSIAGGELRGLLEHIDWQRQRIAELEAQVPRRGRPPKTQAAKTTALVEIVRALVDIVESHDELRGHGATEALAAWSAQQGTDMPPAWTMALEMVLTD